MMPAHAALRFTSPDEATVEGLLCPFGVTDTYGTQFTPQTNFALSMFPDGARPLLWHHALDEETGADVIGRISRLTVTPAGLVMRAVLDKTSRWFANVRAAIKRGAVGLSSGSLGHLVSIDQAGNILSWPVIEGSLTPQPACAAAVITRHTGRADDARAHFRAAGLPVPDLHPPRDGSAADATAQGRRGQEQEAQYLRLLRREAREMVRTGHELVRQAQQNDLAALRRYQLDAEVARIERALAHLQSYARQLEHGGPYGA
jgi:hypothetical protein